VFSDMCVHSAEWIIKEIHICFLVHCTCQAHTLLLTSTQVDTLMVGGRME